MWNFWSWKLKCEFSVFGRWLWNALCESLFKNITRNILSCKYQHLFRYVVSFSECYSHWLRWFEFDSQFHKYPVDNFSWHCSIMIYSLLTYLFYIVSTKRSFEFFFCGFLGRSFSLLPWPLQATCKNLEILFRFWKWTIWILDRSRVLSVSQNCTGVTL